MERTTGLPVARGLPFLAALALLLLLPGRAAAYDVPYRDVAPECYWRELRGVVGGSITYDVSDYYALEWREGVANWDFALGSLMYFDWYSYPNGKTHLRWEGQPPLGEPCDPGKVACWAIDPDWCQDGQLTEAAIYFDHDKYNAKSPEEKVAASAHEWGHNLNLGHPFPLRGMCEAPPRIMGELDGQGCITGPSCAEQAAVIDLYWLLPWWYDRDGDCWDNDDEDFIGTDDWDDCPDNAWDDAWPPDNNNDTAVNILDALRYKYKISYCQSEPGYEPRYDVNVDGCVNILDVLSLKPYVNIIKLCTNP
ncbi:MAG: hypothetical protein AMJ77_07030 [Dehalococcoidia bacterium SM23_28_2]|nr:MAG: hypothetical protein AMJ77_07030 [Dehalococcoidia bacterium SM23_28_2]